MNGPAAILLHPISHLLLLLFSATLFSCTTGQNFSQFPGFREYFAEHPPNSITPSPEEIELLRHFKPRVYVADNQRRPVDFYIDYIGWGELQVDENTVIAKVTRQILNTHKDKPDAAFTYNGNYKDRGTPVSLARFDIEKTLHEGVEYEFSFLTYNFVFPVSGILQGLGPLQSATLAVVGNLDDWHKLDHYVGLTIALLDSEPVAVTLQQHNYHTTYLLDSEVVSVDVALRSNELYLHRPGTTQHPAVSFLTSDNIEFILTGKNKPLMAGFDITSPSEELIYDLRFLPPTDAFYQFKGSLGKSRLLPEEAVRPVQTIPRFRG